MTRKIKLLSDSISNLLISQLAHELKNYNLYKSFANYYAIEGIKDLETYFTKRSTEELVHHEWIQEYLTNADIQFTYPAVEKNTETFGDHITPFRQTIDREIQTTDLIYKIVETCLNEKDFMTFSWLNEKLVKEQVEEENISRAALDIMETDADIYSKGEEILNLLP